MKEPVSVSVIGPGALGSAMIDLVSRHSGFALRSVWGRTLDNCYIIGKDGEKDLPGRNLPSEEADLGEVIIVSVPDDQIAKITAHLSESGISWNSRKIIHLSGSLDSSVLRPLANRGALTGSLHPLQTFTRGDTAERFDGIWFSMQGDDQIFPVLRKLIEPFGGQARILTSSQKSAMHLAAVFASNYLVSLMEVVTKITEKNGIEDGFNMLEPIVQQTLQNVISKGSEQSLSGPVARGDQSTIEKHLNQLEDNPEYYRLYCQLGKIAVTIAEESGQLDGTHSNTIRNVFESGLNFDE